MVATAQEVRFGECNINFRLFQARFAAYIVLKRGRGPLRFALTSFGAGISLLLAVEVGIGRAEARLWLRFLQLAIGGAAIASGMAGRNAK